MGLFFLFSFIQSGFFVFKIIFVKIHKDIKRKILLFTGEKHNTPLAVGKNIFAFYSFQKTLCVKGYQIFCNRYCGETVESQLT